MRRILRFLVALPLGLVAQDLPWPSLEPLTWEALRADPAAPQVAQDPMFDSPEGKNTLLTALDGSLTFLRSPQGARLYADQGGPEVLGRILRSLERFRVLVREAVDGPALQAALAREFIPYRMKGQDGRGAVHMTGYFEAFAEGSRTRTATYRYPLYRKPKDLERWPRPHPTRLELEGADGLQGAKGPLKGLELVWLKDRFEAFLVHVQGSACIQLPEGRSLTLGYAGRTDHPYVSVGQELEKDLRTQGRQTLNGVYDYLRANPAALNIYLPKNPRFVFFTETKGAAPKGSLGVSVTTLRSIATDKRVVPPGALLLLQAEIPTATPEGKYERKPTTRFVLDHDSGGAILGPGRIDIYCGGGAEGRSIAGGINGPGQAYLLLLKP